MKDRPLVSICIPAYNAENTIEETLRSVLAQSYKPIEIIVSDNHSTDGTYEILSKFRKYVTITECEPKIEKTNLLQESLSAIDNINKLLCMANADLIAVFHADDIYSSTIVEEEVNFLHTYSECGTVFTLCDFINVRGEALPFSQSRFAHLINKKTTFDCWELIETMLVNDIPLNAPSMMCRRALLIKAGPWRKNFEQVSDLDMWLRMARLQRIGIIPKMLFKRRMSPFQDSWRGQRLYRYKEVPFFPLMRNYLDDPEISGMISERAKKMFAWKEIASHTRLAANFYANRRTTEGDRLIRLASRAAALLSPISQQSIQRWELVRKSLKVSRLFWAHTLVAKCITLYMQKIRYPY